MGDVADKEATHTEGDDEEVFKNIPQSSFGGNMITKTITLLLSGQELAIEDIAPKDSELIQVQYPCFFKTTYHILSLNPLVNLLIN